MATSKEVIVLPLPHRERDEYKDRDTERYKDKYNIRPILVLSKEVGVLVLAPNKDKKRGQK